MTPDRQRRLLLLGTLAVVATAFLISFLGRASGTRGDATQTLAKRPRVRTFAAADPVPPPPEATPDPAPAPAPKVASPEPPRAVLPPAALARDTAADYRRRARYPRSSQPLAPDEDPIVREREVTPIRERGPGGEEPVLTIFPLRPGFEAPEPAVVLAHLSVGETKVAAREIRATVTTEDLVPVADLVYRDDGSEGDALADDRVYTAAFAPGDEALARSYLVQVTAVGFGNVERRAATSFLYSSPHAHLTGYFRDALVGGSLLVSAEVEVRVPGRFHLEATLADGAGVEALAWAQNALELTPGLHWIPLAFYGLILHERQVDGPYLLRAVALSTATQMPNAKNRLLENAHRTQAYRAAAFSAQPFEDPELLDAAERLEQNQAGLAGLDAE
jgi:hypothetical protein